MPSPPRPRPPAPRRAPADPAPAAAAVAVLVVDDEPVVAAGVRAALHGPDARGDIRVRLVAGPHGPHAAADVVVVGGVTVDDAAEQVRAHAGTAGAVLVFASFPDGADLRPLFDAGARGLVTRRAEPAVLGDAVRALARGELFVCPRALPALTRAPAAPVPRPAPVAAPAAAPLARLTPRERDVFALTARGVRTADVAGQLRISPKTVRTYRLRVNAKLGIGPLRDYIALAGRLGLLDGAPPG